MYKIKTEKGNPNKNILSNLTHPMIKLNWETHSQFQLLYSMNSSTEYDIRIPAAQCIFQDLFCNLVLRNVHSCMDKLIVKQRVWCDGIDYGLERGPLNHTTKKYQSTEEADYGEP